jgi:hypothetical protein
MAFFTFAKNTHTLSLSYGCPSSSKAMVSWEPLTINFFASTNTLVYAHVRFSWPSQILAERELRVHRSSYHRLLEAIFRLAISSAMLRKYDI